MPARDTAVAPPHPPGCLLSDLNETRKVLYVIGHPGAKEGGDLMKDVLYVNVSASPVESLLFGVLA